MKKGGSKQTESIVLPTRVVSRRDVLEAASEFEDLRDNIIASSVDGSKVKLKVPSERAKALMTENGVTTLTAPDAERLAHGLQSLADRAPMLRFTFAGEPSGNFMKELVRWVRSNINASALILYAVQPQIAGGYILTTDTRRHDMSWRAKLNANPLALGELLRAQDTPEDKTT